MTNNNQMENTQGRVKEHILQVLFNALVPPTFADLRGPSNISIAELDTALADVINQGWAERVNCRPNHGYILTAHGRILCELQECYDIADGKTMMRGTTAHVKALVVRNRELLRAVEGHGSECEFCYAILPSHKSNCRLAAKGGAQ